MTAAETTAALAGETKSPKEAFRLGGDPPSVARLSRKSLAILGVVAGLSIGGALIYALQSPDRQVAPEIYATEGRSKADAIASGPKDYSQVPVLGAPLPGDLGKPILSAQQRDGMPAIAQGAGSRPVQPDPASSARERARQEAANARSSQLFLSSTSDQKTATSPQAASIDGMMQSFLAQSGPVGDAQSSGAGAGRQSEKVAFLEKAGVARSVSDASVESPPSANVIQAGSVIPAALVTGVRSDLPGQISAQVTQNVYDSPTGRLLLIPQGSRLIGEYDSQVDAGQTRLLMAWTRLIMPGGTSIRLDRQPGTDASGFSGLQDKVDNHWGGVARAAMISTLLGFGTELAAGSDADIVRALRRGTQDTVNQAGQQIVQRQLGIPPTLTIRPGHPLRVMVTRDLILEPTGER
ncbi:TrbI/VirB10 family protein [Sphingobium sp.]|uniref:TrbI/VirB10 family protein n=1 Tax=Sphingobium sp. TaxID=1912891 RepID=UPI003B3A5039